MDASTTPAPPQAILQRLLEYEPNPEDLLECAMVTAGTRFPTLQFLATEALCTIKPLQVSVCLPYRLWTYLAWNLDLRVSIRWSILEFRIELRNQGTHIGTMALGGRRHRFPPSSWKLLIAPGHPSIDYIAYHFGMRLFKNPLPTRPNQLWCKKTVEHKHQTRSLPAAPHQTDALFKMDHKDFYGNRAPLKRRRPYSRPAWAQPIRERESSPPPRKRVRRR